MQKRSSTQAGLDFAIRSPTEQGHQSVDWFCSSFLRTVIRVWLKFIEYDEFGALPKDEAVISDVSVEPYGQTSASALTTD